MLKFVTKRDYWSVLDQQAPAGATSGQRLVDRIVRKTSSLRELPWHLKSIQDSIARFYLQDCDGLQIGEIGGGNSRVLAELCDRNICYNIDEFRGEGNGPVKRRPLPGVINVYANVGEYSNELAADCFDLLFSISVLEHVKDLDSFFGDCSRLLRRGGKMLHLIDVYLEDSSEGNRAARKRVQAYRNAMDGRRFLPYEPEHVLDDESVAFSTTFATNPDNMMRLWNESVPSLKSKRELAQSCALLMIAVRV